MGFSRLIRDQLPTTPVLPTVLELGIHVESYFDAHIPSVAKKSGLSLADKVRLGLGLDAGLPVVTADKVRREIGVDIDVMLIR